ncbi:MAG: BNR-4 repeat-containing protein [Ignavibacteria bacterium]
MKTKNKKYYSIVATIFVSLCLFTSCSNKSDCDEIKLVDDGAWLWFNDQNILVDDNAIYIGSEGSNGVSRMDIYLFNVANEKDKYQKYPLGSWAAKDDHNYPSLLKLSTGKLLAVYSKSFSNKMNYRIADIVNEGSDKQRLKWSEEKRVELNYPISYNNVMSLSDEDNKVFEFFANFKESPTVIISDSTGDNWGVDYKFMKQGEQGSSPYMKYCDNGKDRIDILYTDGHPRNEPKNSIYHIYYKKEEFYRTDGKFIRKLEDSFNNPISPEEGTLVYDGRLDGPAWVWDIEYDSDGNPVAAYISSADGEVGTDLRYRYAKWNEASLKWEEKEIAYAGTNLYVPENHFAGGITIDPTNTNVVFISTDVDPVTGKTNATGHYQIYRGETLNEGTSWSWKQITFDKDVDNLRPIIPRNHNFETCVVWFKGVYNSSVDFQTSIYGVIE